MKIFIVLPTYNEKENLEQLVKEIFFQDLDIKILVVDDNSPDGTGRIADGLARKYNLGVIHRPSKMGLGTAYRTGFQEAIKQGADVIFEMDADFSHDPKKIPEFIDSIRSGNDAVVGSRRIKHGEIVGWNWIRRFESAGAMWLSRVALGLKTKDVTSGFKCYTAQAVQYLVDMGVGIKSSGYAFQEETIYRLEKKGFKVSEIPIIFKDRALGKSKLSKKDIINFFTTIWRLKVEQIRKKYFYGR